MVRKGFSQVRLDRVELVNFRAWQIVRSIETDTTRPCRFKRDFPCALQKAYVLPVEFEIELRNWSRVASTCSANACANTFRFVNVVIFPFARKSQNGLENANRKKNKYLTANVDRDRGRQCDSRWRIRNIIGFPVIFFRQKQTADGSFTFGF